MRPSLSPARMHAIHSQSTSGQMQAEPNFAFIAIVLRKYSAAWAYNPQVIERYAQIVPHLPVHRVQAKRRMEVRQRLRVLVCGQVLAAAVEVILCAERG